MDETALPSGTMHSPRKSLPPAGNLSQSLRDLSINVVQRLKQHGFEALWAGGCVRDLLLGLDPHDYDVATNAQPNEVRKLFPRSLAVGAQFGVIEVLGKEHGSHVQVATFRSDGTYTDGRRPDSVTFGSAEEDAQRRDFTINGLFMDPLTGEVIDYVNGRADLKAKIVRAIGNPHDRFAEDKLRLLRAVRFSIRLGFTLEANTREAIRVLAPQATVVSPERITDELRKMMAHPHRYQAAMELNELGLLRTIFSNDSLTFSFGILKQLPERVAFPLAWAALLLGLNTGQTIDMKLHAAAFRLSNEERDTITFLLESVSLLTSEVHQPFSVLKPLAAHSAAKELWQLAYAMIKAKGSNATGYHYAMEWKNKWTPSEVNPPPLLKGQDLYVLGVKPGPDFGRMLNDVIRPAQLNETISTREEASALVLDTLKHWNK